VLVLVLEDLLVDVSGRELEEMLSMSKEPDRRRELNEELEDVAVISTRRDERDEELEEARPGEEADTLLLLVDIEEDGGSGLRELEDGMAEDSPELDRVCMKVEVLDVMERVMMELEDAVEVVLTNPRAKSPPPFQLPPHIPLSIRKSTWKIPPASVCENVTSFRGNPLTRS